MIRGFTRLSGPVTLAGRVAQSRVMFGPHETNLGQPGGRAFSPRHVAYYETRAAGGAGLIVTEAASVHASDWPYERAPLAAAAAGGWQQIAAGAVLWLASDEARYVTGVALPIDADALAK